MLISWFLIPNQWTKRMFPDRLEFPEDFPITYYSRYPMHISTTWALDVSNSLLNLCQPIPGHIIWLMSLCFVVPWVGLACVLSSCLWVKLSASAARAVCNDKTWCVATVGARADNFVQTLANAFTRILIMFFISTLHPCKASTRWILFVTSAVIMSELASIVTFRAPIQNSVPIVTSQFQTLWRHLVPGDAGMF